MPSQSTKTSKKSREERPAKRAKLLSDSESDGSSDEESGGVPLNGDSAEPAFKVNEEFAKRYEHNSKRAELQRRKVFPLAIHSQY